MIETIRLLNRRETVFILNRALGLSYDWHHVLMQWTSNSKASYSVLNCEIRLYPYALNRKSPLYRPADLAQFIKDMRQCFPEMTKAFSLSMTCYDVDTSPAPPAFVEPFFYTFRKATPVI